jgi:hypothetical protein
MGNYTPMRFSCAKKKRDGRKTARLAEYGECFGD